MNIFKVWQSFSFKRCIGTCLCGVAPEEKPLASVSFCSDNGVENVARGVPCGALVPSPDLLADPGGPGRAVLLAPRRAPPRPAAVQDFQRE